jgi:hypothetical protein
MWNARVTVLCCCLAALPLIGCAGGMTSGVQQGYVPPPGNAAASGGPRVYAYNPAAPAAILVFLPGSGAVGYDPALWAAQGFDVLAPSPSEMYRFAEAQNAALAQLVAQARTLADAPIWLVGAGPEIDAAIAAAPQLGQGKVSGVVVTSVVSGSGSCTRSMTYSNSGNGAVPKVTVKTSGDACGPGGESVPQPPAVSPIPGPRPSAPKIIEARLSTGSPTQQAVERVAQLIKATPSS